MDEVLKFSVNNKCARITVNRPDALNALNREVLTRLDEVLSELESKSLEEVRLVELHGAGEKAFVAGADIKLMAEASPEELAEFIELGQRVMRRIETLNFPAIAAVDGFAIGGGLELALACDLIVASSKARFGQAEVNLGLIPGFGGTQRLVHRVGLGSAKRLILLAENIKAEEALSMGLVDWVVAPEELSAKLEEITSNLLTKGPLALAAAKRCIEHSVEASKLQGLANEVEEFRGLFRYADTREGLQAFIEKRKANFSGN